jgi:hypothetical protein
MVRAMMGANSDDPSSPEIIAEDALRLADFQRTRMGVPWDEIKTWMDSWGSSRKL